MGQLKNFGRDKKRNIRGFLNEIFFKIKGRLENICGQQECVGKKASHLYKKDYGQGENNRISSIRFKRF